MQFSRQQNLTDEKRWLAEEIWIALDASPNCGQLAADIIRLAVEKKVSFNTLEAASRAAVIAMKLGMYATCETMPSAKDNALDFIDRQVEKLRKLHKAECQTVKGSGSSRPAMDASASVTTVPCASAGSPAQPKE